MKRARWKRIRGVLEQVVDLDPSEREGILESACGKDAALRAEVDAILAAGEKDPGFLETSAAAAMAFDSSDDAQLLIGQVAGAYGLDRFIASGGMGSVFLGTHLDGKPPRTAAVKLLKQRVASPDLLRRFEVERQSLSSLDHPNIARMIDAGVLESGRPYLVMEYIDGLPIDRYCDEHRLSIADRLVLFRRVCSAVMHAHQRLIVHRDLKPSNILVVADGTPKLLDFGISKALDTLDSVEPAAETRTRHRVMTPEYASPEQIRGAHAATSADVYSLGVVLYELLTGLRPYQFASRTPHEMERTICEQEPQAPSKAILRHTASQAGSVEAQHPPSVEMIARARREHPGRLGSALAGELDAIVMKALRKEPEHRYSSVEALSDDVGRYLNAAPVLACRGTVRYRLLKFVGRNRVAVIAGLVTVISLVVGLAVALWQGHVAAEARLAAEVEARKAQSVNNFLQDMLAGVDPFSAESDEATVRQILDDAAGKLESGALTDQPEAKAAVHLTMGKTYLELGLFDAAETHLQQALGLREELLGRRHPDVAACLSGQGMLARARGAYEHAEALYRESLEIRENLLGPQHPDTAESRNNLGVLLKVQGRYAEAEEQLREALRVRRMTLPQRHEDIATTSSNLAAALKHLGRYDEAESLYRQAIDIYRAALGPEHLRVAGCMNNLALLLRERGEIQDATTLLRDALVIRRRVLGDDHPAIATGLHNLALILHVAGEQAEAEPLYREALALRRAVLGEAHPSVANTANNLADLLISIDRFAEAETMAREALEIRQASLPPDHPRLAASKLVLGKALLRKGDVAGSEQWLRDALAIAESRFPPHHKLVVKTQVALGACLTSLGRFAEAEGMLLAAHQATTDEPDNSRIRALLPAVVERLEFLYTAWGKPEDAARYRGQSSSAESDR